MPLGYKYAERTAPTEVDWYQVGKDMSDMLTETNRVREEKKDALAKAQRESIQALADTPNGQNESIRAAAIKYSNMATNNLKIQYDLMTRGQLDPKDWMIYRQNTLDGTDLIFNANKAYQENFKSILEDNQNKIDSGLTLDNAKEVENIAGNWNSTDFNLSPNGTVIVSKLVEKEIDGKKVMVPSMEPGESLSASSMNQLLLNRIPFPKTEEQIKSWVNNLGEEKNVIINNAQYLKQGSVITVSDISSRTDLDADGKTKLFQFVQAENDTIDTFLGTSQNTASVLYDLKKFTGDNKPFQIVTDSKAAAKDPSLILKVYNKDTGMYDYKISDVQKKEAESWVRNQMRAQYNYEEKADVGSQLTKQYAPSYMYGSGDKDVPPPVKPKEILNITKTNSKTGAKRLSGISQKLDNLRFEEANGIENVVTDIGYNEDTGALEIKGYQVTGKESQGEAEDQSVTSYDDKGNEIKTPKKVTKGKNVTARRNLVSQDGKPVNDLNSASLLSSVVTRIPNPYEPGTFFRDINQAKDYYRRVYQSRTGGPKPIQFDQNGNIIQ